MVRMGRRLRLLTPKRNEAQESLPMAYFRGSEMAGLSLQTGHFRFEPEKK